MIKRKILFILLILAFTIPVLAQTTNNIKKPKVQRVAQAYGYLIGQEHSINIIKNEFPQFENDMLNAEMAFNSTFGKSRSGIKEYLLNLLGEEKFIDFDNKLILEIENRTVNVEYSEEMVLNFIEELKKRANGDIETPILETFLSFEYADSPHQELLAGFTTIFKTKGHLKSKNTDWQIRVPKSWRAKEADRPNIIQNFIDDFGDGLQGIMLMVKDIPTQKEKILTEQEKDEFFSEEESKEYVPDGATFISFTKMNFDNKIGGMLEVEQVIQRLDFKLKIRMVQFMFIFENKVYSLVGSVSSFNIEDDLTSKTKKYLPLYKLVANSIVINEQYK
jgi:hypothetical protein